MSQEVEFKNSEELKKQLLEVYLNKFLEETGLKLEDVLLVEHKDENGDTIHYFAKKTEKIWRDKGE